MPGSKSSDVKDFCRKKFENYAFSIIEDNEYKLSVFGIYEKRSLSNAQKYVFKKKEAVHSSGLLKMHLNLFACVGVCCSPI